MKKWIAVLVALLLVANVGIGCASVSDPSMIVSLLDSVYQDEDTIQYEFSYDETSTIYSVNITVEGMAVVAYVAQTDDSTMKAWMKTREILLSVGENVLGFIKTMSEDENPFVSVNLKNDQSPDNVLFSSLNSIVVYDAATGENLIPE